MTHGLQYYARTVACPTCGVAPTKQCVGIKSRKSTGNTHIARIDAYLKHRQEAQGK